MTSLLRRVLPVEIDLEGSRIVVTAAASGIGREIALSLADCGARVFASDIDTESLAKLPGHNARIVVGECDMSDPAAIEDMVAAASSQLDGITGLVNNAGIAGPTAPADQVSLADWQRTLAINLDGAFVAARSVAPHLKSSGGGSIVNLSSAAIARGGFPRRLPYAVSKVGVLGLTQTLAMDFGSFGVRVNAVLPGTVAGERVERVIAERAAFESRTREAVVGDILRGTSLRKMVQPEEIAWLVAFLMSNLARSISGQEIAVCGNFEGHHSG